MPVMSMLTLMTGKFPSSSFSLVNTHCGLPLFHQSKTIFTLSSERLYHLPIVKDCITYLYPSYSYSYISPLTQYSSMLTHIASTYSIMSPQLGRVEA